MGNLDIIYRPQTVLTTFKLRRCSFKGMQVKLYLIKKAAINAAYSLSLLHQLTKSSGQKLNRYVKCKTRWVKGVTPVGLEYVSLKLHLVNVVWIRGVREWGKLGRSPWGLRVVAVALEVD